MATWTDVERFATALPHVEESTSYGGRAWKVKGKTFVWDRPLRSRDREELGDAAPTGEIIGVRVAGPVEKELLVDNEGPAVFTVDHFEGYNAVLIQLEAVAVDLLEDLIVESWFDQAPAKVAAEFRAET